MLINDITESIRNRLQLNFLYRSGKPSKYSDNELKARVVSPVRFKITGLSKTSRSAASLKMDAIDEAYLRNNVEVLVKEGFADNPNDLIELARKVAREALDDEEGRINPQGNYENELVTAVFGQPESAPQIRNAKLRQLLEDKKLQHAYRSYDVDALAGLVPTARAGSHLIGLILKTITRPSMINSSSPPTTAHRTPFQPSQSTLGQIQNIGHRYWRGCTSLWAWALLCGEEGSGGLLSI